MKNIIIWRHWRGKYSWNLIIRKKNREIIPKVFIQLKFSSKILRYCFFSLSSGDQWCMCLAQPARQMHTSQKESQVAARGKLHNINSVFQNMTKLKRSVLAKEVHLTLFTRRWGGLFLLADSVTQKQQFKPYFLISQTLLIQGFL